MTARTSRIFITLLAASCILAAVVLPGCTVHQDYFVNPDGSGKLTVHVTFRAGSMDNGRDELVTAILDSQNVTAFTDLLLREEDGHPVYAYTIYFKDITKVQIGTTTTGSLSKMVWRRDDQNRLIGSIALDPVATPVPGGVSVTDVEMAAALKAMRGSVQNPGLFDQFHANFAVHGAVQKASGFKADDQAAAYTLEFDGTKAAKVTQAILKDEDGLKAIVRQFGPANATTR